MENEAFFGDWDATQPEEESGTDMTELDSNFTEADEAARAEAQERVVVEPLESLRNAEDGQLPPEGQPSDRSLRERRLLKYQEQERARVPELLGKILTTEYKPKPRHKIDGELGRKGRRGL